MKRAILLLLLLNLMFSCSLLKLTTHETEFNVDYQLLEEAVHESVNSLLNEYWLSDFLVQNNQRPIIMTSNFTNPTNAIINIQKLYDTIDFDLIESGQVRVVISNAEQRIESPRILSSGRSVDYVLSATFEKKTETTPPILILQLSLWNENSPTPISTITKEIN